MTKKINRKMKLTAVRNTTDGNEMIGCRAAGIYKGFYIERTSWQPIDTFMGAQHFLWLEKLATGKYNDEINAIDSSIELK